MKLTDREVIMDIQAGNINTFEILVEKYSSKIQSFIASRLFDRSEVDDIVQESFIKFYKALPSFDIKKPVFPYLLKIARNELYMYFRRRHITVPLNDDIAHLEEDVESGVEVSEIVKDLKPDNKKALIWFTQGYSYREIAKRLGKPLNTVRTLIRRARLYIQKDYQYEK